MLRSSALLPLVVLALSLSVPAQQQQLSEEEKKRIFLKAREEMTTIPYTPPTQSPSTVPKPKPRVIPGTGTTSPPPTPIPAPPTPAPVPPVTPPLRPPEPQAPIVVRESAVAPADEREEEPENDEPGMLARLFGAKRYKYISPSVKRAIDRASIRKGRWRYIVMHNSGTRQGSAKAFEHYHRRVRRMPNGMAYHFVIGNGTSTGDGSIEIGNRWHRQIQGGHVHSDYLNNIALGICFVGDFNNGRPTKAQLAAAEELVTYLRGRVGRVGGQKAAVRPHKSINPPRWPTDCPGDDFDYSWFRRF